jgi:hypothetical protein
MHRRHFALTISLASVAIMAILCTAPLGLAQFPYNAPSASSATSIPEAQLIQPEALNRLLLAGGPGKPVVFQVGSHLMFAEAHVAGSVFAGSGSQPGGLQMLASKVASINKQKLIVLYCGCCPWNRCPNVGPAYKQLRDLGFTNVKVLYLANNFGDDWVAKGYRVEHGQ